MKKKLLALTLFSLLATSCTQTESIIKTYNFDYSFDSSMGVVNSSVAKGEHEEGTKITLTSTCLDGYSFLGYFDSTNQEILSNELTYTFELVKDTSLEIRFNKENISINDESLGVLRMIKLV